MADLVFNERYAAVLHQLVGSDATVIPECAIHRDRFMHWHTDTTEQEIAGISPRCRHSGGNTLMLAQAMRHCQSLGLQDLDLKGTMMPGAAHYFWGFTPRQEAYHRFTLDRLSALQRVAYQMLSTQPIRYDG